MWRRLLCSLFGDDVFSEDNKEPEERKIEENHEELAYSTDGVDSSTLDHLSLGFESIRSGEQYDVWCRNRWRQAFVQDATSERVTLILREGEKDKVVAVHRTELHSSAVVVHPLHSETVNWRAVLTEGDELLILNITASGEREWLPCNVLAVDAVLAAACLEVTMSDGAVQIVRLPVDNPGLRLRKSSDSVLRAFAQRPISSPLAAAVVVTGLRNFGNTCFMNAALQCLLQTPALQDAFLHGEFAGALQPTSDFAARDVGETLTVAWSRLLRKLCQPSADPSVEVRRFKEVISRYYPIYRGYQQQDATNFVMAVLQQLHEELNVAEASHAIARVPFNSEQPLAELAGAQMEVDGQCNDSIVSRAFHGWTRTTLKCAGCGTVQDELFDSFLTLRVPTRSVSHSAAPGTENISLEDCLRWLSEPAPIASTRECTACHRRVGGIMRTRLWRCPDHLVVAFDRTDDLRRSTLPAAGKASSKVASEPRSGAAKGKKISSSPPIASSGAATASDWTAVGDRDVWDSKPRKHHKLIRFPVAEPLELRPFLSSDGDLFPETGTQYECYGVVHHAGNLYGHCTAFVKRPAENQWYLANDEDVRRVSAERVVDAGALTLFYRRL